MTSARLQVVSRSPRSTPGKPWGIWFSAASSTLLPRHQHEYAELNLIMSGTLAYRLDDASPLLEGHAGQLIALPPAVAHELTRSSEDLALWVIELKGTRPPGWLTAPAVSTPTERWRKAVLGVLRKLWMRPPDGDAIALQERLWAAFSSAETIAVARPLPIHPAVLQAKHVCERHSGRKLDISSLAEQSGLSSSRLAHLFAEQLGITPLQYRNFAHVQRFIRSYDGDERKLLSAALAAGFGSYAQFHRAFRQVCGETPAAHFKWLAKNAEVDARRTLAYVAQSPSADSCAVSPEAS